MDPCNFLRIVINNLAIKFPSNNSPNSSSNSIPPNSYFCRVNLTHTHFSQSSSIPIAPSNDAVPQTLTGSLCFTLSQSDIDRLRQKKPAIKIDVYSIKGAPGCGFGSSKLLGRVAFPLNLTPQVSEGRASLVVKNGWVQLGGEGKKSGQNPELYLSVKVNPDPRFVFEFDGEPECSPQVFQIQGSFKQPVFSCKFGFRSSGDLRSMGSQKSEKNNHNHLHKNQSKKERKGWCVTIHDLSGSPVAVASMVTPFVPSPGSCRVSRSNPGAWLILRPGDSTWVPWGRLEAWRDPPRNVGYRFELFHDAGPATVMGPDGINLAQSAIPARPGGKFSIDVSNSGFPSPAVSPGSSVDFGSWSGSGSEFGPGWWTAMMYKGFVMSSTVGGGRAPAVEVGSQHVSCTEDAAVFVALAAAMDLSMDACRPFSEKLRKELRQSSGELVV